MSHENKRIWSTFSEKSNVNGEYPQPESEGLSVAMVLYAISDDKSLSLFRSIANSSDSTSVGHQPIDESRISMSHINLTHSQYYTHINRPRSMGLINRRKARYSLSSLGRILYETQNTIDIAIQNRWKLVALDSLESAFTEEGMPFEDRNKYVHALLGDRFEIKNTLLHSYFKKWASAIAIELWCRKSDTLLYNQWLALVIERCDRPVLFLAWSYNAKYSFLPKMSFWSQIAYYIK